MSACLKLSSVKHTASDFLKKVAKIEVNDDCSGASAATSGRKTQQTFLLACKHSVTVTLNDKRCATLTMNVAMIADIMRLAYLYPIVVRMSEKTAAHVYIAKSLNDSSAVVAQWIASAFLDNPAKKDYCGY